jgi:hypothetical protein
MTLLLTGGWSKALFSLIHAARLIGGSTMLRFS